MPRRSSRPLVLAVDGPSGSGKSTVTARAAARFGWAPLAEAYDRLDPRPDLRVPTARALARVERALLVEEGRRWETARALRDRGVTVIADTGFLGPLTYTQGLVSLGHASPGLLTELVGRARAMAARGAWGLPDMIVYLSCRSATRRLRAAADPARHPELLRKRHEAVGDVERRFYRALPRWYPGRVRFLDADGPVDSPVEGLLRLGQGIPPAPVGSAAALRVLAALEPATGRRGVPAVRRRPVTVKKSALPPRAPSR